MKLIAGLGNYKKEFEKTVHNAGFFVVGEFQKRQKLDGFSLNKKLEAEISENGDFWLVLPQTLMNNSGKSVLKIAKFFKLKPEDILIAHDDCDLMLGNYKIQFAAGAAGHRGVESVIKELGTKKFWRLRIGARPEKKFFSRPKAGDFVLKKFSAKEIAKIENLFPEMFRDIYRWLGG